MVYLIKNLLLIFSYLVFSTQAMATFGPVFMDSQHGVSVKDRIRNFKAPNNSATQLTSDGFLIETGNNNILKNPSFEHLSPSTAWVGETIVGEPVEVIHGKKSAKIVLSNKVLNLTQDSTTYASQADGVQGLLTVRIKTLVSGLRVCARQAGVINTSLCVSVSNNGKWGLYKIPFILGSTSNGLSINSNGVAVSGTVFLDDANLGAQDVKQEVSGCNDVKCETEFSANISSTGVVSSENLDWITGNCSVSPTGTYTCTYKSGLFSAGPNCTATAGGGAGAIIARFSTYSNNQIAINISTAAGSLATEPISLICQKSGIDFTNAKALANGNTYSSNILNNTDRIGEVIQTTNSTAPQGFISALNKSIGQAGSGATYTGQAYFTLYEHLWSIAGLTTTAGSVYHISSAKGASASADFAANKTITIDYETNAPFIRGKASTAGVGAYAADQFQGHRHDATYSGSVGYGGYVRSNGAEGLSNAIGSPITDGTNGTPRVGSETRPKNVSLNIFIRYAGDTQLAVAQLSGLESCKDSYECSDTFSATVSGNGVVVSGSENIDWISGNCTATNGAISCSYKTGLNGNGVGLNSGLNCSIIPFDSDNGNVVASKLLTSSSTGLSWVSAFSGTKVGALVSVVCQKSGADYIGKTAKAVASDQNVRSIGAVGVDIQSVYFGSGTGCSVACSSNPCTICNKVGSKISGVTFNSTGVYSVNGIDGTKYICNGSGKTSTGSLVPITHPQVASGISYALAEVSGNVANATFTCIGVP